MFCYTERSCILKSDHVTRYTFMSSQFFFLPLIMYSVFLTLKVLVTTIDAQWEGMGDVGSVRYEPALLPPWPTIRVLSCSN